MNISKELGLPDFLQTNLPPLELNYYGAAKMVADRLGLSNPPVSHVSWMHGWRPEDIVRVNQLAFDAMIGVIDQPDATKTIPAHKRRPYLVPRKAHETLLRENGFPDSRAVGLPFSYVEPDPTVTRIPGSLLVMPSHVLLNMDARSGETDYLEYIRSIAHSFTRVVFCVNLACTGNGLWINNLRKYGFDYVLGAGLMDQMALFRMRRLFDTFEYMTSNGIGSHFIYSGMCGVKVSLAGPLDHYPWDLYKNEPCWQIPEEREKQIWIASMLQHDVLQKKFPWLYKAEPKDGQTCVEWAREEAGYDNRVSFEELACLFGWIPSPVHRPEPFLETVLRLDAADTVAELVQFIQDTPHDTNEMVSATLQLLAKVRLRAAYLLAMLLAKRGHRHVAISLAQGIGGVVYNNPVEAAEGLAHLSMLADNLSIGQQTTLQQQIILPVLAPLLAAAIEQANDPQIHALLVMVNAAVPRFRPLLEQTIQGKPPGPWIREPARLVLRDLSLLGQPS